jgi:hypothetical protein
VHTGATAGHRRNLELDGDFLAMSVMGDTNVELRFTPPVEARVRCYADDPGWVAARLRTRALG